MTSQFAARKPTTALLILLFTLGFSSSGRSCEPIVPLFQLLGGSTLAGPALILHSLGWLLAAVAVKSAAFAFLERRSSWDQAALYMLLANVVSTLPGLLVAGLTSTPPFEISVVIVIPLVFALGWMVRRRVMLRSLGGPPRWISGGRAALAFTAFFFISVATFALAGKALETRSFVSYWLLKFLFVAMAACMGMLVSAVLEECVIASLSSQERGNVSFFTPVLRANYITLALVLLVAAIEMLPKRLNAPHFLVLLLHSFSATLG